MHRTENEHESDCFGGEVIKISSETSDGGIFPATDAHQAQRDCMLELLGSL